MKQCQAVGSDDLFQSQSESVQEVLFVPQSRHVVENVPDQMRKDFGVRLRPKLMTLGQKLVPQLLEIFDDSIVNERELSALVQMWMSVAVCHAAMRCPPGMSDTGEPMHGIFLNHLRQTGYPARAFPQFHLPVRQCRNAG